MSAAVTKKPASTRARKTASTEAPTRQVTHGADAAARILDAADELFYREGARAVGIDAVVKLAGMNKMSLYRQFSSKDELLRQYLLRRDDKFFAYFNASVDKHPDDARAALLQIFTDLATRTSNPTYRGCPFVNVAVEFPDPQHFARVQIADNKHRLLGRLTTLAKAAGAKKPAELARSLGLLIEGAYAGSQTYGADDKLLSALPGVAKLVVDAAIGPIKG